MKTKEQRHVHPDQDKKQSQKRVLIFRLAIIAVDEEHHTAYVDDITN